MQKEKFEPKYLMYLRNANALPFFYRNVIGTPLGYIHPLYFLGVIGIW
jgi:hypothetical protein